MKFLLAAVALAIVTPVVAQGGPETVMRTEAGLVRGVAGGGLVSWKGIPFAAPPVGALRWRNPQPPVPWSGVREAGVFGPACMQTDDVPKSEDCLTLNVWRPAAAKAPLPVMAWIYGGAMVHGNTAMYPFDAMAAKGIVIVSMNYRLGRLGFFAHPALAAESPGDVRGNYGYMDQLAALKWIQRNIAAFGGDPSAVTIFGESAGGGSVLAHLVSPMSRGLFRGAILQSPGTPSARAKAVPSSALAAAEKSVLDWSRSIGIAGDGAGALAQLRALPPERLLEGASPSETLKALALGTTPPGMAMSIVDGRFLPEPPEAALAAGRYAAVPVMVGANDRDLPVGFARSADEIYASFGSDAREARRIYDPLGNLELDELKQQVFADKAMLEPTRHLANELARAGRPVWLYRFEYVSGAQRGKNMGALHGFEIPFTLNVPDAMVGPAQVTGIDRQTADAASGYWVQFGLTGDPNGGGRLAWPRHDVKVDRLLHFTNSGLIVGTDPVKARLDLVERARAREGR